MPVRGSSTLETVTSSVEPPAWTRRAAPTGAPWGRGRRRRAGRALVVAVAVVVEVGLTDDTVVSLAGRATGRAAAPGHGKRQRSPQRRQDAQRDRGARSRSARDEWGPDHGRATYPPRRSAAAGRPAVGLAFSRRPTRGRAHVDRRPHPEIGLGSGRRRGRATVGHGVGVPAAGAVDAGVGGGLVGRGPASALLAGRDIWLVVAHRCLHRSGPFSTRYPPVRLRKRPVCGHARRCASHETRQVASSRWAFLPHRDAQLVAPRV